MCGRYTAWAIARGWGDSNLVYEANYIPTPTYNAAATQALPVLEGGVVHPAKWGVTAGFSDKLLINATAEKLTGPFWKRLLAKRCIVLANGFYDWDKDKQPWYFTLAGDPVMGLAGVMDGNTFAIVTVPANGDVSPVHSRMPVILPPEAAQLWLDSAVEPVQAAQLALPLPGGTLTAMRVGKAVGNVRNNGPELIAPLLLG